MLVKKPDDRLDSILDSTLARCANIDAPAGLEERILAELARRKGRRGRGIQIGAFVLMTALFLSALFRPVNSAEIAATPPDQTVQPTIRILEIEEPAVRPANSQSVQVLFVAQPVDIEEGEFESIGFARSQTAPTVHEDSFISDFDVESLGMATLHLADLSSTP